MNICAPKFGSVEPAARMNRRTAPTLQSLDVERTVEANEHATGGIAGLEKKIAGGQAAPDRVPWKINPLDSCGEDQVTTAGRQVTTLLREHQTGITGRRNGAPAEPKEKAPGCPDALFE